MFNPTIETKNYEGLVELVHSTISKFDQNAHYLFKRVNFKL